MKVSEWIWFCKIIFYLVSIRSLFPRYSEKVFQSRSKQIGFKINSTLSELFQTKFLVKLGPSSE